MILFQSFDFSVNWNFNSHPRFKVIGWLFFILLFYTLSFSINLLFIPIKANSMTIIGVKKLKIAHFP